MTAGRRIGLLLAAAVVIELLIVDQTAPQLTRGGTAFDLEHVPNDTVVSQEFAATQRGLSRIAVAATVTGTGSGHVDARLLREGDDEDESEIFGTRLAVAAGRPCCTVEMPEQRGSRGAMYRFELRPRDVPAGLRLDLGVRSAIRAGGLIINGHRQAANLVIDADVGVDRLPGEGRISLPALTVALGAITFTMLLVITALAQRPSSS